MHGTSTSVNGNGTQGMGRVLFLCDILGGLGLAWRWQMVHTWFGSDLLCFCFALLCSAWLYFDLGLAFAGFSSWIARG